MGRLTLAALVLLALTACGGSKAPEPAPAPETFLGKRGSVMPLHSALREVSFKPHIPSRHLVETALIPGYNGGDDIRSNRGIGFEYVSNHQSFVLQEWPGNGHSGAIPIPPEHGCALSAYRLGDRREQQGVLWSSRGVVSNLVPSGSATPRATIAEARRLVRNGACR